VPCQCGACATCRRRSEKQAYYLRNRARHGRRNRDAYWTRKASQRERPEPSDSELDSKALQWLVANGMR
jgi:hypothetical protein